MVALGIVGLVNDWGIVGADIPQIWSFSVLDSKQQIVGPLLANGYLANGMERRMILTLDQRRATII